ncbi:MAG: LD-carboxypeptidase [Lachnospiraceae bacterium]|nr:LD-carboxypeptidase [Lachnospiraceae bacterium]
MRETALRMPERIRPGDTIGVVAPGSPISPEEGKAMTAYLEKAGYWVRPGKTLENRMNFHGYLAGDARTRAEDINTMFADPDVKGILCARGGYGSSHTIEYLDLEMIRRHPKVFIGYSDNTNYHSVLNKYCDLITFHGPMAVSNMLKGFDAYSRGSLRQALGMSMTDFYEFKNPPEDPMNTLHPGKAKGLVTGGNISLLAHSVGTFYQPDTEGKILFIEDEEESIPRLDMMITQMEQAGMTKGIRALLIGNFKNCSNDHYDRKYQIEDFLRDRFADYKVPVVTNLCSGHKRPMGTIPMGAVCSVDASEEAVKVLFGLG